MRWKTWSVGVFVCAVTAAFAASAVADGAASREISPSWWDRVQQDIRDSEYHLSWQTETLLADLDSAWHAPNREQGLRTYFTEQGIRVIDRTEVEPSWEWGLSLTGWGRGHQRIPAESARLSPEQNRIELGRGNVTEWYINDRRGLEQGFTLAARPEQVLAEASDSAAPVFLELELRGNLKPLLSEDRQTIDFETAPGQLILRYSELVAFDATGRQLDSWMEVFGSGGRRGVRLWIDDREARYPLIVDPLAFVPSWTANSGQASSSFASSVASAGDVNGDGFGDVIVGAPVYDNGFVDEGRAYVFFGSSAGLSTDPDWEVGHNVVGAWYGWAVSTMGDVNGDGYSDIIVGARLQNGTQITEGRVFGYYGSASGPSPDISWSVDSDQDGAQLGYSAGFAGDVNDDGYSDVILGAPFWDAGAISDAGRVTLHFGSANGLSSVANWTVEGDQENMFLGWSVGYAGDVDGDGMADVFAAAPNYDAGGTDNGRVLVFLGSGSGPSTTPDTTLDGTQDDALFGFSAATAGDVDGDGFSEIIVGARLYDNGETDEGAAFLYAGSTFGLETTPSWSAEGDQVLASFGFAVAAAGDIGGDGLSDVLVGAPFFDNGEVDEGRAYLYEGTLEGLSVEPTWVTEGDQDFATFGRCLATAGDVDADGFADVIVGAPRYTNDQNEEGQAFLFLGSVGGLSTTPNWTAESDQDDAELGFSVAAAGDVNGDRFDDLLVGAPLYDGGLPDEGQALLFYGSRDGASLVPDWTAEGGQGGARLGWSVSSAGDITGDGFDDVIVGAPQLANPEAAEGLALVYYGTALSGLTRTPVWIGEVDQPGAAFGSAVGLAGDVNGDGKSDVIVGAPLFTNGETDEGAAFVFHGSSTGLSDAPDWSVEGNQADARFGAAVSSAGDVNRDGLSDVVVGAPLFDAGSGDEGAAHVYRGTVFGLNTAPLWSAEGALAGARFGAAVSSAGDVNGDGYSDVIVGAPGLANPQSDEGAAYVYEGMDSGLSATAIWQVEGNQANAEMGTSVSGAGDTDGDGFAEVIVGAPGFTQGQAEEGRAQLHSGSASGLTLLPSWIGQGEQNGARFGSDVSAAGDLNSDGYGDLVVGAPGYDDGESDEGRVNVYFGNGLGGFLGLQQRQADDDDAIGQLGLSEDFDVFRIVAFPRPPFGMVEARFQWEVQPLGTPYTGVPSGETTEWVNTNSPEGIAAFTEEVNSLLPGTPYHWRARVVWRPSSSPYTQKTRWFTKPMGGAEEADLRTNAETDLGVSHTDSKDPVFVGESYTYAIDASNSGPQALTTTIQDTIPPNTTFVSATPSQGECIASLGVVRCFFGELADGESASVDITVTPLAEGVLTNTVEIAGPGQDQLMGNNFQSIPTTVVEPALGNRVWADSDGNGLQDPGELGVANVLVAVYTGSGALVDTAVTDADGLYGVPALVFGDDYFVRFFPPPGFVLTAPDQGEDDAADSDADPFTLESPVFSLVEQSDLVRWDAGLVAFCNEPDETVFIAGVGLTQDGNDYPILTFLDGNQPAHVTGYNVYRTSFPASDPSTWPLIASDVIDMDEATPNQQYLDTTGDVSPSGIWFYHITAFNNRCPAEGPF